MKLVKSDKERIGGGMGKAGKCAAPLVADRLLLVGQARLRQTCGKAPWLNLHRSFRLAPILAVSMNGAFMRDETNLCDLRL